jgi:hypothetical protein
MAAPFYAGGSGMAWAGQSRLLDVFLVPESELRTKGVSDEVFLERHRGGLLELTLDITRVNERASLDISIWGSSDGEDWGARPVIHFPRKYHCGESKMLWDPAEHPYVQRLRAKWQVDRWGTGDGKPRIALSLRAREVPRHPVALRAGLNG